MCRLDIRQSSHLVQIAKEQLEWDALWTSGVLRKDLMENIVIEDEDMKVELSQCIWGRRPRQPQG